MFIKVDGSIRILIAVAFITDMEEHGVAWNGLEWYARLELHRMATSGNDSRGKVHVYKFVYILTRIDSPPKLR